MGWGRGARPGYRQHPASSLPACPPASGGGRGEPRTRPRREQGALRCIPRRVPAPAGGAGPFPPAAGEPGGLGGGQRRSPADPAALAPLCRQPWWAPGWAARPSPISCSSTSGRRCSWTCSSRRAWGAGWPPSPSTSSSTRAGEPPSTPSASTCRTSSRFLVSVGSPARARPPSLSQGLHRGVVGRAAASPPWHPGHAATRLLSPCLALLCPGREGKGGSPAVHQGEGSWWN